MLFLQARAVPDVILHPASYDIKPALETITDKGVKDHCHPCLAALI